MQALEIICFANDLIRMTKSIIMNADEDPSLWIEKLLIPFQFPHGPRWGKVVLNNEANKSFRFKQLKCFEFKN